MKLINLKLDPLVIGAIDRIATLKGMNRSDVIRSLIYKSLYRYRDEGDQEVIDVPSWPKALQSEPRIRLLGNKLVDVDANGLVVKESPNEQILGDTNS